LLHAETTGNLYLTMSDWISLRGLALLVAANSAPVVAAWIAGSRVNWPLDGGKVMKDGRQVLGAHKTWRGLGAAVLLAGGVALALGQSFGAGAAFGAAAMLGDALSSFIKRRLDCRPGAWLPGLDQLPEAALPLWLGYGFLDLDTVSFTGTLLAFSGLDLIASRTLGSSRRHNRPG
jgi:CDP-2,3-bis-(O-geranylgeranyl)-sn-glycerol synthase